MREFLRYIRSIIQIFLFNFLYVIFMCVLDVGADVDPDGFILMQRHHIGYFPIKHGAKKYSHTSYPKTQHRLDHYMSQDNVGCHCYIFKLAMLPVVISIILTERDILPEIKWRKPVRNSSIRLYISTVHMRRRVQS